MRRKIDLVDDEQIGPGDAGAAFRRNLVACRNIDDVNRYVRKLRGKSSGEIIAARLDQDQVELGKLRAHVRDRGEVHRSVLADRGVRAAAGLDTGDTMRRRRTGAHEKLRIP